MTTDGIILVLLLTAKLATKDIVSASYLSTELDVGPANSSGKVTAFTTNFTGGSLDHNVSFAPADLGLGLGRMINEDTCYWSMDCGNNDERAEYVSDWL